MSIAASTHVVTTGPGVGHVCEICQNSRAGGNAWRLSRALRVALVDQAGTTLAEAEVGPDCLERHANAVRALLERRIGAPAPYTVTARDWQLVCTFPRDRDLIEAVRALPFARFNGAAWTVPATREALDALTRSPLDRLAVVGPLPAPVSAAEASSGAVERHEDTIFLRLPFDPTVNSRLSFVPGRRWDRAARVMTLPASSAGAAAEAVEPVFPEAAEELRKVAPDAPPALLVEPDFASGYAVVLVNILPRDAANVLREARARWDPQTKVWRLPLARLDAAVGAARPFTPTLPPELRGRYLVVRDRDSGAVRIFSPALEPVDALPASAEAAGEVDALAGGPSAPAYLWPFQARVYPRLAAGNVLLALDVGLGKTVVTIAGLQTRHATRSLIVTPASVKLQWASELRRFAPELPVTVLEGEAADRRVLVERWLAGRGILITNYDLLLRHEALWKTDVDVLVLDEAQRIKNWSAKRTQLVRQIPARYTWALTGTPLENHPVEIYQILRRVAPTVLPRWEEFDRAHLVRDFWGSVVGYRNLEAFAARIAPAVVRLRKSDVLADLPPLRLVEREVAFPGEVAGAYRALVAEALEAAAAYASAARAHEAADKLYGIRANALTKVLRLRQFCDHPALLGLELPSPKLDVLREEITDLLEVEPKAIVFTQFVEAIPYIAQQLNHFGVATYHGGLSDRAREEALQRFWLLDDVRVLISSDAGSEGLNLQAASVVVNYDLPWTPARLSQRLGRAHRAGQTRSVLGMILVAPADRPVLSMLTRKAALAEIVVDGAEGGVVSGDPLRLFCQAFNLGDVPGESGEEAMGAPQSLSLFPDVR